MTCCRWCMRFWIISSRILQNHLFWHTKLSQCGKGWIVLALKRLNRYFWVAVGRREQPRMKDGSRGERHSWLRFRRWHTPCRTNLIMLVCPPQSTTPPFIYACLCWFIQSNLDVVVFALRNVCTTKNWLPARPRQPLFEPALSIQSAHKDANWITGLLFYGHCLVST